MTLIGHKQMNLPKSIAITCSALIAVALSGNGLSVLAAETQSANKTFGDWCREKASLSPEAKYTVEVLLREAQTTDCDVANQELSSLTGLDLRNNKIIDIKPLQSLTQLNSLMLDNNQISDIKPLQSLTELNYLGLDNNKISDIKPLQSLTQLEWLELNGNQISDIKPLQSLTKLGLLTLIGNPIEPKNCPVQPESICIWKRPVEF
jgi:internalin A